VSDDRDNAERERCQRRLQRLQKQVVMGRSRFLLRRFILLLGVAVVGLALNLTIRWWMHGGFASYDLSSAGMLAVSLLLFIVVYVAFSWGGLQREIGTWQERLARLDHRDHRRNDLLRNK
jgi:uncharacterized membrane protein YcjF (UPF0283 family)